MAYDPSIPKRPLTSGQFAWAISKKSGHFSVIIGPDPMDATDDELFVVPSRMDPTKVETADSPAGAIQNFVLIKPGEYAVIHNPTESYTDDHPNGPYAKGRGEVKPLKHGTKRVVTSGYFPVWPGQNIEVRELHTLSSNQYLMAVVESENIDDKAPYFGITMRCASIKKAVIEDKSTSDTETPLAEVETKLKLGQRIIIPGNVTPTYIPPSGIEIVPETKSYVSKELMQKMGRSGEFEQPAEMVRQAVVLSPHTILCSYG